MTERERERERDEGRCGGGEKKKFFWIIKINKHVWAYSWQHETTQWGSFLAEPQQEMKGDPPLNTCNGNVSFIFPRYGRSALLSKRPSGVSFLPVKSYTNIQHVLHADLWGFGDVCSENISLHSYLQHVSVMLLALKTSRLWPDDFCMSTSLFLVLIKILFWKEARIWANICAGYREDFVGI